MAWCCRRQSDHLVAELLGFNLGIELTQLIVVALLVPSCCCSAGPLCAPGYGSRCRVRIVPAAAWLTERTTLVTSNPLEPISEALVAPRSCRRILAATAATIWPSLRCDLSPNLRGEPASNASLHPLMHPDTSTRQAKVAVTAGSTRSSRCGSPAFDGGYPRAGERRRPRRPGWRRWPREHRRHRR